MKKKIAKYNIKDFSEGQKHSIVRTINQQAVDGFASFSGDVSPLHMDEQFACSRGFAGRVAHGALLISYLSELIGVHFPGENCLFQTLSAKFLSPAYINDTIEISAIVGQISLGANAVMLDFNIRNVDKNDRKRRNHPIENPSNWSFWSTF